MLTAVFRACVLVALLATASGCARPSGGTQPFTTGAAPSAGLPGAATRPPEASGPSRGSSGAAVSPRRTASAEASSRPPHVVATPTDDGRTGSNGYWYLNRTTPALDVEIDAVSGMAPSSRSVDLLKQRIEQVADKPGGVDVLPIRTISSSHGTWTGDDIAAAEQANRTTHNALQRASVYLLFVDGSSDHEGAIGAAFNASSAVIFEDAIRQAATPLVSAQEIERSTMIHEVGHLLSLVNLTYRSPRPHEDPDHPGHSNDPNSVMYWAVDNVGVATLLGGHTAPPTTFDADDLADLSDVRAGKLGPH